MLKIKDNVDLKGLEKFGFENNGEYYYRYIYEGTDFDVNDREEYIEKNYNTLYVNIKTRELFAYNDYNEEKIELKEEYYKDLIESDLVEKVEKVEE